LGRRRQEAAPESSGVRRSALVLIVLLISVSTASAQSGWLVAIPGTQQPTCPSIFAPVINGTWCGDAANARIQYFTASGWQTLSGGGGGGGITSIGGQTGPAIGLTSDTNVTLTASANNLIVGWSGALPLSRGGLGITSGTSGGIPYFASSSTLASSGALSALIVGGSPPTNYAGTGTCTAGQAITAISGSGVATCASFSGGGQSGTVSISNAATTAAVTFGVAMSDTTYSVVLGTRATAGSPPATLVWYKSKTINGFTVEVTSAPGTGNTIEVDWQVGSGVPGTGIGGSGTTNSLAKFTASNAIGNADLTGAVTTSGTVATTLASQYRTKTCVVITGDPGSASPALANDNDSPVACPNDTGSDWTITSVGCWADAGTPTVTPILTGGSGTSVLTGALTCGTASWAAGTVNGSPVVHSFSGGATCSSTPCSIDANITTAGGTAKYVVVKIVGTIP
jgi:hypothetical protein